jgi:hypothetical protein
LEKMEGQGGGEAQGVADKKKIERDRLREAAIEHSENGLFQHL